MIEQEDKNMLPKIRGFFSTDGLFVLPLMALDFGSEWCRFRIHIGWIFWSVVIDW